MEDFKVYQASGYLTKLVADASDVRKTYEEISGSLVEFDTPISAPLAELVVDVNPVQDLHGQDAPYPAGGGKNLFDPTKATTSSGAYGLTITRDGDIYTVSGTSSNETVQSLSFAVTTDYANFDLSGKGYVCQAFVVGTPTHTIGSVWGFRTENEKNVAIQLANVEGHATVNVSFKISVAETSQTAWSPYSNICPITGWTGCEVWVKPEYDASLPATASVTFPDTVYGGEYEFVSGNLKPYKEYDSYNGETLTGRWMSSMDKYVAGTTPTIGAQVVDLDGYDTTVQLTPQEINTLIGVNNIWADTGDVSVKYRTH